MGLEEQIGRLQKRLDRERQVRSDAERIAEELTSQLYATNRELETERSRLATENTDLATQARHLAADLAELRNATSLIAGHVSNGLLRQLQGLAGAVSEPGKKPLPELGYAARLAKCLRTFGAPSGEPPEIVSATAALDAAVATFLAEGRPVAAIGQGLQEVAAEEGFIASLFEQLVGLMSRAAKDGANPFSVRGSVHGARHLIRIAPADAEMDELGWLPVHSIQEAADAGGIELATCYQIVTRGGGQLSMAGVDQIGWQLDLPLSGQ